MGDSGNHVLRKGLFFSFKDHYKRLGDALDEMVQLKQTKKLLLES